MCTGEACLHTTAPSSSGLYAVLLEHSHALAQAVYGMRNAQQRPARSAEVLPCFLVHLDAHSSQLSVSAHLLHYMHVSMLGAVAQWRRRVCDRRVLVKGCEQLWMCCIMMLGSRAPQLQRFAVLTPLTHAISQLMRNFSHVSGALRAFGCHVSISLASPHPKSQVSQQQ